MSEQKRWTAQEIRPLLDTSWHHLDREMVYDIIRQAADAEEENAQLKARLEAVVKECEILIPWMIAEKENHEGVPSGIRCGTLYLDKVKAILRAARGEGGAE